MSNLAHLQKLIADKVFFTFLHRGYTPDGQTAYIYLAVRGDHLPKLRHALNHGLFNAEEHGVVLAHGYGDPSQEVMREMEEKYGIKHEDYIAVPAGDLPEADLDADSDESDEN